MPQYISDEKKQEILKKIKEESVSVSDASVDSGVSTKTIYRWLRDGVGSGSQNLTLENNRLKKELEQVYAMLGKATVLMQRPKGLRS
jgi:transposase-like protein